MTTPADTKPAEMTPRAAETPVVVSDGAQSSMARIVSLSVLTTLIVILGITFFRVVAPFLLPLFLAGVSALLVQPMFQWIVRKTGNRVRLSAGITTFLVVVILTIPVLFGTFVAALELYQLATNLGDTGWDAAIARIQAKLEGTGLWARIAPYLPEAPEGGWDQNTGELVRAVAERTLGFAGVTLNRTLSFVGALVSLFIGMLMYVIAVYYFLADGPAFLAASEALIPVHVDYQRQLRKRFDEVVRAVLLSTFLAAVVQGLLTALALRVAGFHHMLLFVVMGTLAAMIPLAGTWLVWAPCVVWLAAHDQWTAAIGVALFCLIVVGTADNVIRTWILNSDARLHALLAFISVLGGVEVMGLWGVFIGPIVAACLHALVQIFNAELKAWSRQTFAVAGAPALTTGPNEIVGSAIPVATAPVNGAPGSVAEATTVVPPVAGAAKAASRG